MEDKTVLVLHSYNKELFWTDNLNDAIVEELQRNNNISANIRVEYMDTKRFEDSLYLDVYAQFLISKYSNTDIDLIVSTDNSAFEFLKKNKSRFAPNCPVVFCGLNNVSTFPENYTGILEDIDFKANINLIRTLHPNYNTIYIALDNSITGSALKNQAVQVISKEFDDLNYEFLTDYSFSEFKTKLSSLDEKDVLLLVTFNYDKNGLTIPYDDILDEIMPFCNVPIYGTWDFYLNKGIVGGKITSAYYHGKQAGKLANLVLNGEKPDSLEIISGPTKYMFDYTRLQNHNIDTDKLPINSIIINKPENIIQKNKALFASILFILILLLTTILLLLILFRRKKLALKVATAHAKEINSKQARLQEALEESNKANSLQRAFLTNLSHEIRTPMNGIMGFSDLLKEIPSTNTQSINYINQITTNSHRLLAIIDDILEISRIETKKTKKETTIVNLNTLIENTISSLNQDVNGQNDVAINSSFALPNQKANLKTDEVKLKQIISNLIDNAIKFTHKGTISIAYQIKDNEIVFSVADTGIGIKQEDFDIIFSQFGQVEKGVSRHFGGTGLGLSICKAFVELLGGKMWLKSKLGEGSIFTFTHPADFNNNVNPTPSLTFSKQINWEKKTLLIAEDEELNFKFFEALLAPTGINILHADNGLEAVELCKHYSDIDLILMDIKMPDMDGFEAAELIKKGSQNIPIIVQTAHTIAFDHERAKKLGLNHIIHKPIVKKELLSLMSSFLD